MDQPPLTEEQLDTVREFFASAASVLLWQQLEAQIIADWVGATTTEAREKHWHELNAVLQLQAKLRDATPNTRLNQRSQNARATNVRTDPYRPV